jgi:hypothetical protein
MESKKIFNVDISEDDILCKICCDVMIDPKLLTCGHRICDYCLNTMIASDLRLCCPYCRKAFPANCSTDIVLKNIISQITIELVCGKKLKVSDIFKHSMTCLECLKLEYEKNKKLCDTMMKRKRTYINTPPPVSEMSYTVLSHYDV